MTGINKPAAANSAPRTSTMLQSSTMTSVGNTNSATVNNSSAEDIVIDPDSLDASSGNSGSTMYEPEGINSGSLSSSQQEVGAAVFDKLSGDTSSVGGGEQIISTFFGSGSNLTFALSMIVNDLMKSSESNTYDNNKYQTKISALKSALTEAVVDLVQKNSDTAKDSADKTAEASKTKLIGAIVSSSFSIASGAFSAISNWKIKGMDTDGADSSSVAGNGAVNINIGKKPLSDSDRNALLGCVRGISEAINGAGEIVKSSTEMSTLQQTADAQKDSADVSYGESLVAYFQAMISTLGDKVALMGSNNDTLKDILKESNQIILKAESA